MEQGELFKSHLHTDQKIRVLFLSLLVILTYSLLFSSCANRGVLTGGAEDTIPPTLINSIPANQSLDYKGTVVLLTFDERVQAPQLQRKLLITPLTDVKYKVKVNKNIVELNFDQPFSDSTTYTLNFSDAITDVTEDNPGKDVVLAFSTWNVIDSLSLRGKVIDLLSNEPVEEASVSVYEALDTLDIFTGKPYYFARTNENGEFLIQNMKSGMFRVYAFKDENSNYLNESSSESHGFIADTIELSGQLDSLTIPLLLQDVQELKLVNTRSNGSHFDVRYNKFIDDFKIEFLDDTLLLPHNLSEESPVLRFYQNEYQGDSLGYIISTSDTVGNTLTDTIYVKFTDRELNLSDMSVRLTPPNGSKIKEEFSFTFHFDKPIKSFNADSVLFKYDTLRTDLIDSVGSFLWNENRTQITFSAKIDFDFLVNEVQRIQILQDSLAQINQADTLNQDSVQRNSRPRKIATDKVTLYVGEGAFVSIEGDSSKAYLPVYQFARAEKFGKISGAIEIGDGIYFNIQLINSKFEKIMELENEKNYLFDYVPPGKYNIRVLVDSNGDGKWSYGNIKQGLEPEEIYFHPTFIELRENWEINNINLSIP